VAAVTDGAVALAAGTEFDLDEVLPAPQGPLQIVMPCRAGTSGPVAQHEIVLAADWTVSTPHDLALERIAVAMGGDPVSCLDLADREAAALREMVQLRARRALPGLARTSAGDWQVRAPVTRCRCESLRTRTAAEAAEHLRGAVHAGYRGDCSPERLGRLQAAVERAHDTTWAGPPADEWGAAGCVREHDGLARLWDVGLHPELVARIHAAIWPDGPPMPSWFFVGAVTRRADLRWLGETLQAAPDPAVAVWLAWTATDRDRDDPTTRGDWLRAGIPRPAILQLVSAGYSTADIARLAACSERSVPRAGMVLAAWGRAGCRPAVADLLALDRLDVDPWYEPSRRALDWLCARLSPSTTLTRTQVALILAACGTRSAALRAINLGATTPASASTR
jgi:hypothetical protein